MIVKITINKNLDLEFNSPLDFSNYIYSRIGKMDYNFGAMEIISNPEPGKISDSIIKGFKHVVKVAKIRRLESRLLLEFKQKVLSGQLLRFDSLDVGELEILYSYTPQVQPSFYMTEALGYHVRNVECTKAVEEFVAKNEKEYPRLEFKEIFIKKIKDPIA